ncbi:MULTISPECIES: hypothetical protein [unclassified Nocardiopsis]|uniref:hypothetical protein n=1 Tax=unclassified Nocardiopsis TaxID=2649073 RepID=UPI00135C4C97|nr:MULTISPECIES: hypothetical protein [unclassified Nocardiopsis]
MPGTTVETTGRPRAVEAAFLLLLAYVAAGPVTWVLDVLVIAPTGWSEMRAADGGNGLRQLLISGSFTLLTAVLGVILAVLVRLGLDWARAVVAAVGVLAVLISLITVTMDGTAFQVTPYELLARTVPNLMGLTALVLLFLPRSNAYFSRRRGS